MSRTNEDLALLLDSSILQTIKNNVTAVKRSRKNSLAAMEYIIDSVVGFLILPVFLIPSSEDTPQPIEIARTISGWVLMLGVPMTHMVIKRLASKQEEENPKIDWRKIDRNFHKMNKDVIILALTTIRWFEVQRKLTDAGIPSGNPILTDLGNFFAKFDDNTFQWIMDISASASVVALTGINVAWNKYKSKHNFTRFIDMNRRSKALYFSMHVLKAFGAANRLELFLNLPILFAVSSNYPPPEAVKSAIINIAYAWGFIANLLPDNDATFYQAFPFLRRPKYITTHMHAGDFAVVFTSYFVMQLLNSMATISYISHGANYKYKNVDSNNSTVFSIMTMLFLLFRVLLNSARMLWNSKVNQKYVPKVNFNYDYVVNEYFLDAIISVMLLQSPNGNSLLPISASIGIITAFVILSAIELRVVANSNDSGVGIARINPSIKRSFKSLIQRNIISTTLDSIRDGAMMAYPICTSTNTGLIFPPILMLTNLGVNLAATSHPNLKFVAKALKYWRTFGWALMTTNSINLMLRNVTENSDFPQAPISITLPIAAGMSVGHASFDFIKSKLEHRKQMQEPDSPVQEQMKSTLRIFRDYEDSNDSNNFGRKLLYFAGLNLLFYDTMSVFNTSEEPYRIGIFQLLAMMLLYVTVGFFTDKKMDDDRAHIRLGMGAINNS